MIDMNYIRIGQLLDKDFNAEFELETDELFEDAIEELIYQTKSKVYKAICKEFGNEAMLFVGLIVTVINDLRSNDEIDYMTLGKSEIEDKLYEKLIEETYDYYIEESE